MLSILIPVIKYPFFVQTTLENIRQNCDVPESQLDIVFVIAANTAKSVIAEIQRCQFLYHFRYLEAPFDTGQNEGALIDFAMRHPLLNEWAIVQPCGIYWTRPEWYSTISENLDQSLIAICGMEYTSLTLDDDPILLAGGFFGVYNRSKIIELNLSFQWGRLITDVAISPNLKNVLSEKRIKRNNSPIHPNEWVDTGVALSLELACGIEDSLGIINMNPLLIHLFSFHQIEQLMNNNILNNFLSQDHFGISSETWLAATVCYSYLTSKYFDPNDISCPVPWTMLSKTLDKKGFDYSQTVAACDWIASFRSPK